MSVKDTTNDHASILVSNIKRIQRLSPELANQIAAGEVIERPASVLKELLENSLDANSTQIDVTIENAGVGLIKIQDNGQGIHKEDLELALTQHATSKISDVQDLEAILSYGFRGEALASIASVSKMRMTSCTTTQEMGWSFEPSTSTRFSSQHSVPPAPPAPLSHKLTPSPRVLGTTIEVRELFYNTPARRKFLRSDKTEMHYLEEVFKRIVLSHPEVGFSLKSSEKTPKRYNRCCSLDAYARRVGTLCGNSFIENAKYLEAESNGLMLKGWLGNKSQMRAAADLQYFYVNGRIVRDKGVNHAIRHAYQGICTLGRYPAYILFLELDPAGVDVNVHPTKHEVRFREARTIHAFLSYALGESLETIEVFAKNASSSLDSVSEDLTHINLLSPAPMSISKLIEHPQRFSENMNHFVHQRQSVSHSKISSETPSEIHSDIHSLPDAGSSFGKQTDYKEHSGQPLCLLGSTFLLMEECDGFSMIDIQAIHKKIIELDLEIILKREPSSEKSSYQKPLLMPLSIRFQNQNIMKRLKKIEDMLHSLGFFWTESGPDSILLRAVPNVFITQTKAYQVNTQLFENLFKFLLEEEELQKTLESVENLDKILIHSLAEHLVKKDSLTLEKSLEILQRAESSNFPKMFHSRKFTLETLKRLTTA